MDAVAAILLISLRLSASDFCTGDQVNTEGATCAQAISNGGRCTAGSSEFVYAMFDIKMERTTKPPLINHS
jgi:hypothetical protein